MFLSFAEGTAVAQGWEYPGDQGAASELAPFRNGVLVMPSIGFVSAGTEPPTKGSDVAPRMGAILGLHVGAHLSVNGELGFDVVKPGASSSGSDSLGLLFEYAFSPLLHADIPGAELVLGPKLGRFSYSMDDGRSSSVSVDSRGWSYGINFAVLFPVQTMAIGLQLSFTGLHTTEICDLRCPARDASAEDFTLVGLSGALLY
jgi:hypothetical protein